MRTMSTRCLLLPALVVGFLAFGGSAKPKDGIVRDPNKPLSPRDRETLRIVKVMEWARKNNAPGKEITRRIMGPIIAGNRQDIDRNERLARQFLELAAQAKKDKNAGAAKKYLAVATLFKECAKENQHFLKSLKNGDARGMKIALKRLRAYDDRIEQITGKRIKRSWYMLEGMVDTIAVAQGGAPATTKRKTAE